MVLKEELGLSWDGNPAEVTKRILDHCHPGGGDLRVFHEEDFMAPMASGSVRVDAMMIVPCSMKTAAGIAAGSSGNLVERAADVSLKEKRPLIVVPRETPLNVFHLRNLLTLSQAGVHILPAMPGFYNHPKTIDDMVNFVVGRILDFLKIDHRLYRRWTE
jgi:4-hydroxy-3-polyprenylbenzoate decarboxylase